MAAHVPDVPMTVPDGMPTLSRGRHRNPRRGACFMEMASYLAGERWSDHPDCTHPLLGSVARLVNDGTPDGDRQQLAPLVTSVIGLNSDDPRWDVVIARRVAIEALPHVSERRQRALAVALLVAERHLDEFDGRHHGTLNAETSHALAAVPLAWRWATRFLGTHKPGSLASFRRRSAPNVVVTAVTGISESFSADTGDCLRKLLTATIADCAELHGPQPSPDPAELPPLPPVIEGRFRPRVLSPQS